MVLRAFLLFFFIYLAKSHEVFHADLDNTVLEKDIAIAEVKTDKHETTCTFEIVHRDSQIHMDKSSVYCTPTVPLPAKVFDVRVMGAHGFNFTADIQISPDVLIDIVVDSLTPQEMMEVAAITELANETESIHFGCGTKPPNTTDESKRGGEAESKWFIPWPGAVVPYTFKSSFTYTDRLTFAKAVEAIEAATCLKFEPWTSGKYYLRVERDCACGGTCFGGGYTDGFGAKSPRELHIGSACISPSSVSGVGLVIHEILHALGVIHTQTRPDRDQHIYVNWDYITAGGKPQYKICKNCNVHGTPYDCMSVMHYRDWGFQQGGPTMLPRRSSCDLKTGTHRLTKSDIELLNKMYPCKTVVPTNGKWGTWSRWSVCSAKCGSGRRQRYRLCNKPKPKNGGADCVGRKNEEEDCMEQSCGSCAQFGKNTNDRNDLQTFENVLSWADCSTKCSLHSSCTYWTWWHESADKYAYYCTIMNGYGFLVDDPNTVSGPKSCSGCPEKNVNLQDRKNNQVITGIKSWTECSRKCKGKSSCKAWVWVHEGGGDFAFRCGLMDGYGNKAIDSNVISGNRDCPSVDECTGLQGSSSCCSEESPCKEKGGDCDNDAQCEGSLVCGTNNCRDFQPNAEESYDCCVKPVQLCNGMEGTGNCCTEENPCDLGGGDCDSDSDCSGNLVCGYNNCRDFHANAGATHDCCMNPKVDGSWAAWESWSTCTKTRTRKCTDPAPANGGEPCAGKKEEVSFCRAAGELLDDGSGSAGGTLGLGGSGLVDSGPDGSGLDGSGPDISGPDGSGLDGSGLDSSVPDGSGTGILGLGGSNPDGSGSSVIGMGGSSPGGSGSWGSMEGMGGTNPGGSSTTNGMPVDDTCCPYKKILGSKNPKLDGVYTLVSTWIPNLPYKCYSSCVYEKKGSAGQYCFARSETIQSECIADGGT